MIFIFLGTFTSVTRLKNKIPSIKVLLLVNTILPESLSYSRRDFIISVSDVLKTSDFDGLVISDIIPTTYSKIFINYFIEFSYNFLIIFLDEFDGNDKTKEDFPLLIEELASVLKTRGWLLSLIVPPFDQISRNYDTNRILLNLDFVILKSYDFRQDNEKIVSHHSSLYSAVDRDPASKYRNVVNIYILLLYSPPLKLDHIFEKSK